MEPLEFLPLISRWFHILAAVILAGGTFFLRLAVLPAESSIDAEESTREAICREAIRKRWSKLVAASILFLLLSGLYNSYLKAIGYHLDGVYLTLLSVKIVLALLIFFLVSVLAGGGKLARRFRESEVKWYNLTCLAMLAVICIGGYLKLSPQEVKLKENGVTLTRPSFLSIDDEAG